MLNVAPERVGDVLQRYDDEQILQYSLDHSDAISSEISVATDAAGTILVTAVWPDQSAYDGWVENPFRASSNGRLAELLKDSAVGIGRTFKIVHEVKKS
ncbi:hypothetical protein AL755_21190 [Arthrobacter sp. ERGS1:01]|nr:hypothetical protein AL755_21190 [Arthrobacter sp. ERGS1:01]